MRFAIVFLEPLSYNKYRNSEQKHLRSCAMMLRLGNTHRGAQETALPSVFEKEEITDEKDFGRDYGDGPDSRDRGWQSADGGFFLVWGKRDG